MDAEYIRQKISKLRVNKNISERELSRRIGHEDGYIQSIMNGKMLPPIPELLKICRCLDVYVKTFFDEKPNSDLIESITDQIEQLSPRDITLLRKIINATEELETRSK